jgi:hypothetical protein
VKIAASTVWQMLRDAGIDSAPDRATTTRALFDAILADSGHHRHPQRRPGAKDERDHGTVVRT